MVRQLSGSRKVPAPFNVNMRVGSIMSLLGTATGRVFAAFLPPKMIENFIESGVGRASVGDEAERQMSRNQIDKAVAEVREKGLARAVERPIPGVNAFSGNIAALAATAFIALLVVFAVDSNNRIWRRTV